MLLSGAAELLTLGAVLPFLALLSDPQRLWQQPLVQDLATRLGFTAARELLLPATLAFVVAAISAAVIRLTNLWLNGRFAAAVGSDLSCEAYKRTLYQPYVAHVQRNSSADIAGITTQIYLTVLAINSLLQLLTAAVVAAFLLTGLLLINAPLAVAAATLFGGAYGIMAITAKRELRRNSHQIAKATTEQLKSLQEGLGAIRDVLLDGSQLTYLQIYRQADRPLRQFQAQNVFLGAFPRYALEALGMSAIAVFGGLVVWQERSGTNVISLLGVMALGAQRLLPALQRIYNSWASMKGYSAAIEAVLTMLNLPMPHQVAVADSLPLNEGIRLEGVHFRYGPKQPDVLQGLDLEIYRGERIGLIGSTGSGKSTAMDILIGLLAPSSGRVLVDGEDLYDPDHPERLVAWRSSIAHVPQSIYLADSTIAENIAFGIPKEQIDFVRMREAAEQAQIAGFIESSPRGYETFVGERGVRLSGGQCQRIGIARGLYKQASVIVLDEATSALDTFTEEEVMKAIEGLSKELTIIMIAHRLTTLARCDRIFELSTKTPIRITTPSKLFKSNQSNTAIN